MKISYSLVILFLLGLTIDTQAQVSYSTPIPTQAQLDWQNAELVAVFHYDLHVFDGKKYTQKKNRISPIPDYNIFHPEKLDTDQWIKVAKDAGCKIAILTATHETGFALYQSDVNPYCLKAVKWREGKGDIVQDFVNSCHKYGVKPGIYIGIRWNSFYGIHDFNVSGKDQFAQNRQAHYNRICEGMVQELCSRYGDLAIVWFDGGAHGPEQGGPDVLSIFEKYQPNSIFYHNLQRSDIRWGGSESGKVPYPCWGTFPYAAWFDKRGDEIGFKPIKYGDPNGLFYMPAMSDAPLRGHNGRHEWFWEPNDEAHIYPLENLMDMYYHSVGHNSSLILGLTPDPDGLMPEADGRRLKEFGDEVNNRFVKPIAETKGTGNKLYLRLPEKQLIYQTVIMENIEQGERVREFIVEGRVNGKWKSLCEGSCIGHKYITRFEPVEVTAVRLIIKNSISKPVIKSFSVY
ncbi:MAG: alpha-L-fucosidase [Marinilabiliaceae bacterium]|nr:alpha-L-fucosidase [Marinilabiliaceae bacterium]